MNVVDQELSKELFELSGWTDNAGLEPEWYEKHEQYPAYTLGQLIRKLPNGNGYRSDMVKFSDNWEAYLWGPSPFNDLGTKNLIVLSRGIDESPENALCKLAIELFKQGILRKDV